jgi:RNA polymerase sigma-70 factor, ECF subfamily
MLSKKISSKMDTKLSDGALLEAVLTHDELAWQELIRRFRNLIYRCVTKVLCKYESAVSSEEIHEIFGEVCLNLLRDDMKKLRCYDPDRGSKLSSWIGLIAINTTYDHLRIIARQPMLDRLDGGFDCTDEAPGPLEHLLDKEQWQQITALVSDFSPKDQTFLELYFGCGMPPAEVAHRLNISVKTVYSKTNKIRNRLLALARAARLHALAA